MKVRFTATLGEEPEVEVGLESELSPGEKRTSKDSNRATSHWWTGLSRCSTGPALPMSASTRMTVRGRQPGRAKRSPTRLPCCPMKNQPNATSKERGSVGESLKDQVYEALRHL